MSKKELSGKGVVMEMEIKHEIYVDELLSKIVKEKGLNFLIGSTFGETLSRDESEKHDIYKFLKGTKKAIKSVFGWVDIIYYMPSNLWHYEFEGAIPAFEVKEEIEKELSEMNKAIKEITKRKRKFLANLKEGDINKDYLKSLETS